MPILNSEVARIFEEYADLLEIYGANEYRVRAYRNAARNISYLSQNLSDMVRQGEDLTKLPGIAEDLAGKITRIIQTGRLSQLDELKKSIPEELVRVTRVAGIGPRRAHRLYYGAGITSIKELKKAAKAGEIKAIPGFGIKLEQAILDDIERRGPTLEGVRILYSEADNLIQPLLAYLWESSGVSRLEPAGGYRRGTETLADLDILAVAADDSDLMSRFLNYPSVAKIVFKSFNHSSVKLVNGFQIDLRVVPVESFGAAWISYTGSRAHNIAIRKLGSRRRLQINENGVFKNEQYVAGREEEEVYSKIYLSYIEPELRENRGEIESARTGNLPNLIKFDDIRGDLHVHTNYTDGHSTLEEIARAAQEKGYEYIAITEHSAHLTVAHGLNQRRLSAQINEIDKINRKLSNLRLLKSIEVDILEDGSLDMPDEVLKNLDLVIGAVHYKFNLTREKQTERIIRAMYNPYFFILAHPSGRLINEREPYDVDLERIIRVARETGCILELNSQPDRLDLEDTYCKMARDLGVEISISSDAHSVTELNFMRYGVIQGRRGWLGPGNVLNTLSWEDLQNKLQQSRLKQYSGGKAAKNLAEKAMTYR